MRGRVPRAWALAISASGPIFTQTDRGAAINATGGVGIESLFLSATSEFAIGVKGSVGTQGGSAGVVGGEERGSGLDLNLKYGVIGSSKNGPGVAGMSESSLGILGQTLTGGAAIRGIHGTPNTETPFAPNISAIRGESSASAGVVGVSTDHFGVFAGSKNSIGLKAQWHLHPNRDVR